MFVCIDDAFSSHCLTTIVTLDTLKRQAPTWAQRPAEVHRQWSANNIFKAHKKDFIAQTDDNVSQAFDILRGIFSQDLDQAQGRTHFADYAHRL
jgi:hypothetical protein